MKIPILSYKILTAEIHVPISYSKKRKAKSSSATDETHPCWPQKQSGNQAKAWGTYVGCSLDQLPSTQLDM